ncbi:MAG: hypothetical protein FH749_15765 [Firmicutes bacterium]|nr:hypothetical protein [Bacillota bacterium]
MNGRRKTLIVLGLAAAVALTALFFPRGDLHRAWKLIEDEQYTEAAILLEHMLLAEPDKGQLQWLYLEALVGAESVDLIGELYDKLDLTDISPEQTELLAEAAKTAEASERWPLALDLWELAREAGYSLSEEQYQEIIYDAILYGDGHPDNYDILDESDVRYQLAEWLAEERWFRQDLIRRRTGATYASPISYIDDETEPVWIVEPGTDAAERDNHQLAHLGTLAKALEPGLAWLNDSANIAELSPEYQKIAADLARDIGDCLAAVEWFISGELPAMSGEKFLRIADSFLLVSDLSRLPWERLLAEFGDLADVWYLYSLTEGADMKQVADALHGNPAQDFTRPRWSLVVEASWGLPADDQFSYLWWSQTGNWLTLQGQAGTWILYSQSDQAEITLPGPVIWDWHSDALLIMSGSESGEVEYVYREHPHAPDTSLDFTAFDEEVYPFFLGKGELFFPVQNQMVRYEIASGDTRPLTETELWQMLRTQRREPGNLD